MTINDLLKQVPEEFRNCFVKISIPQVRPGDEGDYPLIQVSIDQIDDKPVTIILEADVY